METKACCGSNLKLNGFPRNDHNESTCDTIVVCFRGSVSALFLILARHCLDPLHPTSGRLAQAFWKHRIVGNASKVLKILTVSMPGDGFGGKKQCPFIDRCVDRCVK